LDEAQNTTPQQMKMFLTRLGKNAKVVLNGDLQQSDLFDTKNGLQDFLVRLNHTYRGDPEKMGEDGFGVVELSSEKTYRSSIVRHVLRIYDEDGQ
jgi:phosphate starvation-inducible PhoH-like protein